MESTAKPAAKLVAMANAISPEQAIQHLIGLRLQPIGYAADMLTMQFGDLQETRTHRGRIKTVGEWALHIQVPWRFHQNSTILFGNCDMYYKQDGEKYGRDDTERNSRFHLYAESFNSRLQTDPTHVERINCDRASGFSMLFQSGLTFDVMPNVSDASPDFELWRLFQHGNDSPHYVVRTQASE